MILFSSYAFFCQGIGKLSTCCVLESRAIGRMFDLFRLVFWISRHVSDNRKETILCRIREISPLFCRLTGHYFNELLLNSSVLIIPSHPGNLAS